MPEYRTTLRRSRRGNQFLPAIVGGIGEGLKNLASGLNQKKQNEMDEQRLQQQQQQQEDAAKQQALMNEYKAKEDARAEARLSEELSKTATERSMRRTAVAELGTYLDTNRTSLKPDQIERARRVLDIYGTKLSADKLSEKFDEALHPSKTGTGKEDVTDAEAMSKFKETVAQEEKAIQIQERKLDAQAAAEKAQVRVTMAPKLVEQTVDENDIKAAENAVDVKYASMKADLWDSMSQRYSAGGVAAGIDSTKAGTIGRFPQPIPDNPRDKARDILNEPRQKTDNPVRAVYLGEEMQQPAQQPAQPQSPTGEEMTDDELTKIPLTDQDMIPDRYLERWLRLKGVKL